MYFQRLAERKVLAVVVTRSGLVRDRVLRLSDDLTIADLEAAAAYLNQNFRGWEMESLRNEIARRLQHDPVSRRSPPETIQGTLQELDNLVQWCTTLLKAAG